MSEDKLYILQNRGNEVLGSYWNDRLLEMKLKVLEAEKSDGFVDPTMKSIVDLTEKAIQIHQYERPHGYFEKASRLVRVRINTPRSVLDKYFGLETIGVYGIGLYVVLEGIVFSESFRDDSNYDRTSKRGVVYDLSKVPDDIKEEYNFGLSIPAFEGLFVPKKCPLTEMISRSSQLQFFDMSMSI